MMTTSQRINVYDMESGKFLRSMKSPDIESGDFSMLMIRHRLHLYVTQTGKERLVFIFLISKGIR